MANSETDNDKTWQKAKYIMYSNITSMRFTLIFVSDTISGSKSLSDD